MREGPLPENISRIDHEQVERTRRPFHWSNSQFLVVVLGLACAGWVHDYYVRIKFRHGWPERQPLGRFAVGMRSHYAASRDDAQRPCVIHEASRHWYCWWPGCWVRMQPWKCVGIVVIVHVSAASGEKRKRYSRGLIVTDSCVTPQLVYIQGTSRKLPWHMRPQGFPLVAC